jgi:ATP-dependent DNA helicase RecG
VKPEPSLELDIQYLKGVGETRAKLFSKLGIHTLGDLLYSFPRDYEDRTAFRDIGALIPGETSGFYGIASSPVLAHIRKGLELVKFKVFDDSGSINVTFFNQSYIKDQIKAGERYAFFGKIEGSLNRTQVNGPVFESAERSNLTGRIVPKYHLTSKLYQSDVMNAQRSALDIIAGSFPELLPNRVRARYKLAAGFYAIENIHFPESAEALEIARRRLIFEEFFVLSCAMLRLRAKQSVKTGRALCSVELSEFTAALPFELTGAQARAIDDIAADLAKPVPMSRLVQGDVGSGKTVVAAAACYIAYRSGRQSAFLAPTELLAEQHYDTLSALLGPLGLRVGLLTGSLTAKSKRLVKEKLALGELDLIIGTHAILSEDVVFYDLALAVTDEQHRFGVNQRGALSGKGETPHVLVMSATPIPRTLAFVIYGDLDISVIDTLPPGRRKIDTFTLGEHYRKRTDAFIRKLVGEGRQVYIICPAVEEGEAADSELKAAKEYSEKLRTVTFPELSVGLVHGKMKAKEKEETFSRFKNGEISILVSTTVVEVGVDVPNAALIIIENADRFGLSQLHQLRGRVGRGEHKSYCILYGGDAGETARARLKALKNTNDGFVLAEEDLKLRGPGDFFGERQHGLPELKLASFATDLTLLRDAQAAALETTGEDPELADAGNRALRGRVEDLFKLSR